MIDTEKTIAAERRVPVSKATIQAAVKTIEAQLKPLADFANFHGQLFTRTKCSAHRDARDILGEALMEMVTLKSSLEMAMLTYETCMRSLGFEDDADNERAKGIAAQSFEAQDTNRSGPPMPRSEPSNDGITYPGPRYAGDNYAGMNKNAKGYD